MTGGEARPSAGAERSPVGAARLSELDELSRGVFDTIRESLLVLDPALRVRAANRAFYRTFRVSPEETEGRFLWELGNGQWDVPRLRTVLEEVLAGPAELDGFEVAHRFERIGEKVMVLNARRLVGTRPGSESVLVAIDDITERRRAELELKRTAEELARSNAELERFAYVASHDLQEPLRMVSSFTGLLAKRYQGRLDERADRYIAFAVDGAARMQALINDLLAYARISGPKREFAPTSTEAVLARAVSNLRQALRESGGKVTHGPLPEVRGDEGRLLQLFQNLLANAVKFRGEAPPRVRVSAERRGGEWVFAFADNGIGIEAEYFDRIFVLFQRLHTQAEHPGTGIGLALCRKIVEHHGGRIWVESEPGRGSTFYFTLPAEATP